MNDNRKYVAELLGTFTLVFGGSLTILSAVRLEEPILVPVALGFGLALLQACTPSPRSPAAITTRPFPWPCSSPDGFLPET